MKNEFEFEATLTLNHPLTEEDMDILTDVDFDHADRVWFYTKHGKEVEFVKVTRCENCKWCYDGYCSKFDDLIPFGHESHEWRDYYCSYGEKKE